jgi:DNA-binding SARP family transcriptional activator/DNA-binding response OmpR family regulator
LTYRVLVVDDEPLVLEGLRRQIEPYFEVHTSTDAAGGLAALEEHGPFAVAVVDYQMPGQNGVEFMVQARNKFPRTVRVMLTGRGGLQVVTDALNKGNIFYYLNKPSPEGKLLDVVIYGVEKFRNTTADLAFPEPAVLKGQKRLYRGVALLQKRAYQQAMQELAAAAEIFTAGDLQAELARACIYMGAAALEGELPFQNEDGSFDLVPVLKEAVDYYLENGLPNFTGQERAYYKPVLDWACHNGGKKNALSALLEEAGLLTEQEPDLKIKTLGPLEVTYKGRPVEEKQWRNPKVKMLFLFLLTHRHIKLERDIILDTFWPDMNLHKAGNNLSTTLYVIRRIFNAGQVSCLHGRCWLDTSSLLCDADLFERAAESGFQHARSGDKEAASAAFEEALALYCGDYLAEFIYEDWLLEEKKRLQFLFQKTLLGYAALLAACGHYAEAAELLERAPLTEVYNEELLESMVNYYLKAGKKGKAKQRFNYYSELLSQELGIKPDPKIAALLSQCGDAKSGKESER